MSKITYEQTIDDITYNENTGEIIKEDLTTNVKVIANKKVANEPDYIKVYKYVNTLFAFKGIKTSLTPFVLAISNHMTYANEGQVVNLNKITKAAIADTCNVSVKRLDQVIAELRECDILRKLQNGVYSVNPYICARGNWSDIKKLQSYYDFTSGEMTTAASSHDRITGEDVRKIITNRKDKQIPGQMSLEDFMSESEE